MSIYLRLVSLDISGTNLAGSSADCSEALCDIRGLSSRVVVIPHNNILSPKKTGDYYKAWVMFLLTAFHQNCVSLHFKRWTVLLSSLVSTRQSTLPAPGTTFLPNSSQAKRLTDHGSLTQESKPVYFVCWWVCNGHGHGLEKSFSWGTIWPFFETCHLLDKGSTKQNVFFKKISLTGGLSRPVYF